MSVSDVSDLKYKWRIRLHDQSPPGPRVGRRQVEAGGHGRDPLPVGRRADVDHVPVPLDAKETVLGGVYYRWISPDRAHMEKVVVARKHRGFGVADGLMREFFRRLRARGAKSVETGYFQPEYLRRYGFRTDPTSGGLIADLSDGEAGVRSGGPRP